MDQNESAGREFPACRTMLRNGCMVFFDSSDDCPEGVERIVVKSRKKDGFCYEFYAEDWLKNPVEILGKAFRLMVSGAQPLEPKIITMGYPMEDSVPCSLNDDCFMVVDASANSETTPYVRFINRNGDEVLYYDIEGEFGGRDGKLNSVEAVGAAMGALQHGVCIC